MGTTLATKIGRIVINGPEEARVSVWWETASPEQREQFVKQAQEGSLSLDNLPVRPALGIPDVPKIPNTTWKTLDLLAKQQQTHNNAPSWSNDDDEDDEDDLIEIEHDDDDDDPFDSLLSQLDDDEFEDDDLA